MNEGSTLLLVFVAAGTISALVWHRYVTQFAVATFAATVTTVALFQGAAYWLLGNMVTYWIATSAATSVIALVMSIFIGRAIRKRRMVAESRENAS